MKSMTRNIQTSLIRERGIRRPEQRNVTIVCPDAELADALAGAVFILGEKEGIAMIDQLNGIECLLVNEKDELRTSKKLKLNYYT